jgi:hypothetical protein
MDKKLQKNQAVRVILFAVIMLALIIAMRMVSSAGTTSAKYVGFSQCLADKGAKLYGAFWCPHCQKQKKQFGAGAEYLPYVECSTADGKGTTQVCIDNNATKWPEWVFADGTRLQGRQSMSALATKTGCSLETPAASDTSVESRLMK